MVQQVVFAVASASESAKGVTDFPHEMLPARFEVSQLGSVFELGMEGTDENEGH